MPVHSFVQAEALGKALAHCRKWAFGNRAMIDGLNKAAVELAGGVEWFYDTQTDCLDIGSRSQPGRKLYHVTFLTCECAAAAHGAMCWHSYARNLLERAFSPAAERRPLSPAEYGAVLAKADELT